MNDDQLYYARRAEEQRRAAARAGSDRARRLHLELAALLAARFEGAGERREAALSAHP